MSANALAYSLCGSSRTTWPLGCSARIERRITVTAHDLPAPVVPSTAKVLAEQAVGHHEGGHLLIVAQPADVHVRSARARIDLRQIADRHRGHRRAERWVARHAAPKAAGRRIRPGGRDFAQGLDLEHRALALVSRCRRAPGASALTTPNTRDSGPRNETSAPMRAAEAAVLSSSSYSVPQSTEPWIPTTRPMVTAMSSISSTGSVAVLVVVVKRIFSTSAVQAKSIGQLGATGIGRRALMAGRELRGERTGRCESREAVIGVDRSTRQRRAASIDGRRKRRRPVEMALSVMLEVCSGARVRRVAARIHLPAGRSSRIDRIGRAPSGLGGSLPPHVAERPGVGSGMLAVARTPAAERLCRCVREAESHAMPPQWDNLMLACQHCPGVNGTCATVRPAREPPRRRCRYGRNPRGAAADRPFSGRVSSRSSSAERRPSPSNRARRPTRWSMNRSHES